MKKILILLVILNIALGGYNFKLYLDSKEIREVKVLREEFKEGELKEPVELAFYIPSSGFGKLEKVTKEIEYTVKREEVLNSFIKEYSKILQERGDLKEELVLKNSFFSGRDLYLNFQGNSLFTGDSTKLIYVAYSIANSIIDLGGVDRIKILIDNKEQQGVLNEFYSKNTSI